MPMDDLTLAPYEARLDKWLPKVRIVPQPNGPADATVHWRGEQGGITYLIEHKPHLEHQDVVAVATQMDRYRLHLDAPTPTRLMVLAKFIRRQQGQVFEQRDIDYVDLAGNAHLQLPGRFVHVEGLRPIERRQLAQRRMTRGWLKTVMALLIAPDLVQKPYRTTATEAGVAPATVMHCLTALERNGFIKYERRTRRITNARELVALWVQGYKDALRPKLTQRNFQMKMDDKQQRWKRLADVLREHDVQWVLTGGDAALLIDPHLRAETTELYAQPQQFEQPTLLNELQLQPAIAGNVQVIEPPGPIAFRPDQTAAQFPVAPTLLTYAELRYHNDDQANEAAKLLLPRVLANVEA